MTKINLIWGENGETYKTRARSFRLWDGSGIGFFFYPLRGRGFKCKIPNNRNDVYAYDTGERIGEYDPVERTAVIREVL